MSDVKIPRGQTPERRAYMKSYRETHPKRDRRAYKREYDKINKDKIKAYVVETKAIRKQQRALYYQSNKEKILASVKSFYNKNKDKVISYQKEYNKKNKQRIREREVAYSKNNRDVIRHCSNRRRARKAKNGGYHTLEQLIEKFRLLGDVCFYCKKPKKLTIDHDIPLCRGGSDNIDNILPACKSCNSRKRALTSKEFINKCLKN